MMARKSECFTHARTTSTFSCKRVSQSAQVSLEIKSWKRQQYSWSLNSTRCSLCCHHYYNLRISSLREISRPASIPTATRTNSKHWIKSWHPSTFSKTMKLSRSKTHHAQWTPVWTLRSPCWRSLWAQLVSSEPSVAFAILESSLTPSPENPTSCTALSLINACPTWPGNMTKSGATSLRSTSEITKVSLRRCERASLKDVQWLNKKLKELWRVKSKMSRPRSSATSTPQSTKNSSKSWRWALLLMNSHRTASSLSLSTSKIIIRVASNSSKHSLSALKLSKMNTTNNTMRLPKRMVVSVRVQDPWLKTKSDQSLKMPRLRNLLITVQLLLKESRKSHNKAYLLIRLH